MSRIDIITITIVGLCLIALIYLLSKVANINTPIPSNKMETLAVVVDSTSIDSSITLPDIPEDKTVPNVKQTPEAPISRPNKPTEKTNPAGRFLVVAASFNTLELAEQELKRLEKLGYSNSEIGYFNQRKIVAVIVGRYDDYAVAEQIANKMKATHKVDAYVHRKR